MEWEVKLLKHDIELIITVYFEKNAELIVQSSIITET